MPKAARQAWARPSTAAVRSTSAVSRPGVRVSSAAARVKARRLSAMDMVGARSGSGAATVARDSSRIGFAPTPSGRPQAAW